MPYIKYPLRSLRCTVNPIIGREAEVIREKLPIDEKKKVLILGGGLAGMQAAITAADRGHDVTICEKTGKFGGIINLMDDVSFKEDLRDVRDVMVKRVEERNIKVHLNKESTPEWVDYLDPDVVVAALGGKPKLPNIEGIDSDKVILSTDIKGKVEDMGKKVVIIGGGITACEEAVHLAENGKEVTVVGRRPDVIIEGAYLYREALLNEMKKHKINIVTNTDCISIDNKGVHTQNKNNQQKVYECDIIVVATGLEAKTDLVDSFRKPYREFYNIGDSLKPKKVLEAIRSGYDTGMTI